MGIFDNIVENVNKIISGTTKYRKSSRWKEWLLGATKNHCWLCLKNEHKVIEAVNKKIDMLKNSENPPIHENSLCYFEWLRMLTIGNATNLGNDGADYWIHKYKKLPNNYITKE